MRTTMQMSGLATALALVVSLSPLAAQKKDDKTDAGQQAIDSLVSGANEAMKAPAGTAVYLADPAARTVTRDAAANVPVTLTVDYLKASDNKIYAPFTVTVPAGALGPSANLGVYVRVAGRGAQPPATSSPAAATPKKDSDKKKGKEAQDLASSAVSGVEYPWEDYYELAAAPRTPGGPLSFSRPFSVPTGEYDAYIAMVSRDPAPAPGPLKMVVHKAELTVPDYWGTEFRLSSVFLANKVTELTEVPTGEAQKLKPYVIGNLEISPALDARFTPADELSVFFIIYNAAIGNNGKPDVTIEWQPYKKGPLGESPFKAVPPQKLNSETLPASFDVAQGHQLVGSLNVPVSAFEPGDYRLAIKVTDNTSGKSLTRDVAFTVAGA